MKDEKTCSGCSRGIIIRTNGDVLCRLKGVVSSDYACSRYRPLSESAAAGRKRNKCIDCGSFIVDPENSYISANGVCQMFLVRPFDGSKKNACSRFVPRRNYQAS